MLPLVLCCEYWRLLLIDFSSSESVDSDSERFVVDVEEDPLFLDLPLLLLLLLFDVDVDAAADDVAAVDVAADDELDILTAFVFAERV